MANWFSTDSGPFDPSNFNYDVAAQKVARQRAAAQALQQSSLAQSPGQFVQNGAGTFYAGGNAGATVAAKLIAALLGNQANSAADDSQKQLADNSQAAFNAQYANLNASGAAQAQPQATPVPPQDVPANAIAQDNGNPDVQAYPVAAQAPDNSRPIPAVRSITPATKNAAIHALTGVTGTGSGRGKQGGPTADDLAIHEAQVAGTDPLADFRARQQAQAAKNAALASGPAVPSANLNALATATPAPIQYQTTATQQAAAQQAAASPMAATAAAALQGNQPAANAPTSPQIAPVAAPQVALQQAPQLPTQSALATPVPAPAQQQGPSDAEMVARLVALGRTGPEGQQVAQAALNNLFAGKNGRFTTTVHADPVNGGFVQVVTDSRTGQTQAMPLGTSTGTKVLETKDTPSGVMERTAQGWRPAVDQNGQRVVGNPTAADQRADRAQTNEIAKAQASNAAAIGAIDSTLQRLDSIDALSDQYGGVVNSVVPDKLATSGLRTYRGLIGQDVFSGVRDAVNAGAEGSPRFTQGEFAHFEHNGGLNADMKPQTVKELTAQQRSALLAKRDALIQYGKTLAPSTQGALPPRQPGAAPQQLSYASFGGNQ